VRKKSLQSSELLEGSLTKKKEFMPAKIVS
jgi:hypothetical protein